MDEFKDIDTELMRLKEELNSKHEDFSHVKFPSSGDYWRSRLDEERVLWDKKVVLGSEERKALEKKLNEQEELLSRYNQSVREMERKIENDTKLWEDRLRIKEADIMIEKSRLQSEARVKEIELERQSLMKHVTELSLKISELRDDQAAEIEILNMHAKQDADLYEQKLKVAAAESDALKNRMSDAESVLKARISELEKLKEEYRVRLEAAEKKAEEEARARFASDEAASKTRAKSEEDKIQIRKSFETTTIKFAGIINKDVGALAGLSGIAADHELKKETLLIIKGLTGKLQSELGGFEKELNLKFDVDDNFKAAIIMSEDEAAYWEAALSGTRVTMEKLGVKSNVKKSIPALKPCVCVVSLKKIKAARTIKARWPFVPVIIYGELPEKRKAKLEKGGFITVSSYGTADDMYQSLCDAAKNSAAQPDYWGKVKIKSRWVLPTMYAAATMLLAGRLHLHEQPCPARKVRQGGILQRALQPAFQYNI